MEGDSNIYQCTACGHQQLKTGFRAEPSVFCEWCESPTERLSLLELEAEGVKHEETKSIK